MSVSIFFSATLTSHIRSKTFKYVSEEGFTAFTSYKLRLAVNRDYTQLITQTERRSPRAKKKKQRDVFRQLSYFFPKPSGEKAFLEMAVNLT